MDDLLRSLAAIPDDWLMLCASALVVTFLTAAAALMGFRNTERLDEARMRDLAGAEGASADAVWLAPDRRAAVARLSTGALLVARVLADGVSARVAQPLNVSGRGARARIAFSDIGFPPLEINGAPSWLIKEAPH